MTAPSEEWLAYAYTDIQSAEVLVGAAIYGQACFHCQQCVEKAFKSILVKQDRLVPRIHSIFTLS
jgi:HEPN domain-containing protein